MSRLAILPAQTKRKRNHNRRGLPHAAAKGPMIYDVSVPILNTMPVWPSDPPVKLTPKPHPSRDKSHVVRVTSIAIGSHTGTHIDAPYHMIEGGLRLNQISLQTLVGPVVVLEVPKVRSIKSSHLEKFNFSGIQRILFKTDNSQHWNDGKFYEKFVYLEPEAAEFLVERDIKLVGIDYLSIDQFESESHPTHFVLLRRNVVIIEGLNLSQVPPGSYHMTALPLNLQDLDGAPTRVILEESASGC